MPSKILEGRQQTAPEGCPSEKSTRRSPRKSIITDKRQKLLQRLLRAGNKQHPKGVLPKNQHAVAQEKVSSRTKGRSGFCGRSAAKATCVHGVFGL